MGIIEIEGMQFYAYHGHFSAEQVVGNNFEVNIRLEADCHAAAQSDNLDDALNYQAVYETIKEVMMINSALLEHVASRILDAVFDRFPQTLKARVKVSKMNPPMGGQMKCVSVTMER